MNSCTVRDKLIGGNPVSKLSQIISRFCSWLNFLNVHQSFVFSAKLVSVGELEGETL